MMIYNINISLYAHVYVSTGASYGHHESQLAHVTFCTWEIDRPEDKLLLIDWSFRHSLLLTRRISMKNLTENSEIMTGKWLNRSLTHMHSETWQCFVYV